jgi:dTDP-4-amino-4,6-dideoxygalactose transaminase/peptidoglycan/xylan/chitin deacetylase (PgdA/CDA1 family)
VPARAVLRSLARVHHEPRGTATFLSEIGHRQAFFLSSGRAALTVLLDSMQRHSARREIVIPAYTCFSVAAAIARAGLTIRLCDVEPQTLDLDLNALRRLDLRRVLCIVPSSLYGLPGELGILEGLARDAGAFLIDDAAQCLGATKDTRPCGTFGDAGFYSLGRGKGITAMGGGIVVSHRDDLVREIDSIVRRLPRASAHAGAIAVAGSLLYAALLQPSRYWLVNRIPFLDLGGSHFDPAFAMTRLSAYQRRLVEHVLPLAASYNKTRREHADHLRSGLHGLDGITLPRVTANATPVYVRFPLLACNFTQRTVLLQRLRQAGIGASASYPAAIADIPGIIRHLAPDQERCSNARSIASRMLTLPTHPGVAARDIDRMVSIIRSVTDTRHLGEEPGGGRRRASGGSHDPSELDSSAQDQQRAGSNRRRLGRHGVPRERRGELREDDRALGDNHASRGRGAGLHAPTRARVHAAESAQLPGTADSTESSIPSGRRTSSGTRTGSGPSCHLGGSVIEAATRLAKRALAHGVLDTGAWDLLLRVWARRGTSLVLTYHRVLEKWESTLDYSQPGMVVTVSTFERQLTFLARHFEIVPLGALDEPIPARRPRCVITFDDGWRDNYELAFPILRAHGIPATIFLTTDFVGTERVFWHTELIHLLLIADLSDFLRSEGVLAGYPSAVREALRRCAAEGRVPAADETDALVETVKARCDERRIDELIGVLARAARLSRPLLPGRRFFLDWDQVREMAAAGMEMGSHGCSHRILTRLSTREARQELGKSKTEIERRTGRKVLHFAFPNNDASPTLLESAARAGYRIACAGGSGVVAGPRPIRVLRRSGMHEGLRGTGASHDALLALGLLRAPWNRMA